MKPKLKKIRDQVIVITGASSGIGLSTARLACERGARVVLAARNEQSLRDLTAGMRQAGCEATYVVADVSVQQQVERIANVALERFGRIDSWVNNAAVSIYGNLLRIPVEEQRRVFEVNYWGIVYGSLTALRSLKGQGGALINMGSGLSDRAIPKQGPYSASKHAIKGFTDALRMEVEEAGWPVSITLIKPSAIDTPYKQHAKNYLPKLPKNPPPVYAPRAVAEAILHVAEHPTRDVFVGLGGKFVSTVGQLMPRLSDKVMEKVLLDLQQTDDPAGPLDEHNLYTPGTDGDERGHYPHYVSESSVYAKATLHPAWSAAAMVALSAAAAWAWRMRP